MTLTFDSASGQDETALLTSGPGRLEWVMQGDLELAPDGLPAFFGNALPFERPPGHPTPEQERVRQTLSAIAANAVHALGHDAPTLTSSTSQAPPGDAFGLRGLLYGSRRPRIQNLPRIALEPQRNIFQIFSDYVLEGAATQLADEAIDTSLRQEVLAGLTTQAAVEGWDFVKDRKRMEKAKVAPTERELNVLLNGLRSQINTLGPSSSVSVELTGYGRSRRMVAQAMSRTTGRCCAVGVFIGVVATPTTGSRAAEVHTTMINACKRAWRAKHSLANLRNPVNWRRQRYE